METSYSFTGRIALITGGGDGLGFTLAEKLAAAGAAVCLVDVSRESLDRAKAKIGQNCRSFPADITDGAAMSRIVPAIVGELGKLDLLVNCAGITGKTNLKSHEVNVEDFDRVMAVNVRGTLLACQAALPAMLRQNYGRILNVASIAGKEGNAGMVAYSTSKAAVIGLTKSMGKEYAETGITINALAPAVLRTAMVAAMPPEQVKYMTDKIPMKRCGVLEEFAATAMFILSEENSFTTGFTFDLSGGRAVY